MTQTATTDGVEETIRLLKSKPGFHAYIVMNNDGIVVKYENMEYRTAVMYAYHVLELYAKTKAYVTELEPASFENELECLRLHTKLHELLIAQSGRFTFVVLQLPCGLEAAEVEVFKGEEVKEKEEDKTGSG